MLPFLQVVGRRWPVALSSCTRALVLITATSMLAAPTNPKPTKTRTTHSTSALTQAPNRVPGLPFDRVVRPGLQRELAKVRAAKKTKIAAAATSRTASLPNFGGFLAAPMYLAFDFLDQDNSPLSVFASGDFNKDGKPDLVTVQSSGVVNVILNQGGGAFGSPISTLTDNNNVGGAVQALTADLNKDGKDDLVLLDATNNTVDVLLSNGDGTFGTPQFFNVGSNYVASMAVADVNGDGYPDLVVVSSNLSFAGNSVTTTIELDTLLNDGHGGFLAPTGPLQQIFTLTDEYDTLYGRSVALADVNGDGILDATVETRHWLDSPTTTEDSEHVIMTLAGTGGGAFALPDSGANVVIPSESTFNIGYPLVANLNLVDLNHDGIKDIVFSYQDYFIWAVLGNGTGPISPITTSASRRRIPPT